MTVLCLHSIRSYVRYRATTGLGRPGGLPLCLLPFGDAGRLPPAALLSCLEAGVARVGSAMVLGLGAVGGGVAWLRALPRVGG